MEQMPEACPFDAASRAARCVSCSAASEAVPPCVAAYLGGRRPAVQVISLVEVQAVRVRRAA